MEATSMSINRRKNKENVIRMCVCVYTMEYDSAIKKNEIMPIIAMWINLEMVLLSEKSQAEKDKYHMILLICGI